MRSRSAVGDVAVVVAIMKGYDDGNWESFMKHLERAKPRYGDTFQLPFGT